MRRVAFGFSVAFVLTQAPAGAQGTGLDPGWDWLSDSTEIQGATLVWNDRLGDGEDRWKSGGVTQSVILPERLLGGASWIDGRASALEVSLRGLVMTPDDTAFNGVNGDDRAYAQYASAGAFLRSAARPAPIAPGLALQVEDRIGIEIGWQGEPLPLFDIQEAFHGLADTGGDRGNPSNSIGGEFLANVEARRGWRFHNAGDSHDVEVVPFIQGSAGMRENSLRVGGDVFVGSPLEGRLWGTDPATGAVFSQASMPRRGTHWSVFFGGDVGYVASDAFLDGGFDGNGPSVERREIVGRARAGVLVEHGRVGVGFSLNWLGREFETQPEAQLVGALQLRLRF